MYLYQSGKKSHSVLVHSVLVPLQTFLPPSSSFFFFATPYGMQDISSLSRDRTQAPCLESQSLNHWTTRESPSPCLFVIGHLSALRTSAQMVTLGTSWNTIRTFLYPSSSLNCSFTLINLAWGVFLGFTPQQLAGGVCGGVVSAMAPRVWASLIFHEDRWCSQWGRNRADVSSYLQVVGERQEAWAPGKGKWSVFKSQRPRI